VLLPASGTYTVQFDPAVNHTGVAHLRVIVAHDQQGTITIGGPEVVATIGQAGAVSRFTFTGTAGQRVKVDATGATLPDECGIVSIVDVNGHGLASGCVINGKGGIETTNGFALPSSGQYILVVDPGVRHTGSVHLSIHT